jgi:hypothetical protein
MTAAMVARIEYFFIFECALIGFIIEQAVYISQSHRVNPHKDVLQYEVRDSADENIPA